MILDDCSCSYTPNHPGVISLILLSWEITFCRETMYWHHLVPPRAQVPSLDEECVHPWTRPGVRAKRILADQKLGSCVANPVLNHNYCFGQLLHMNSGYDMLWCTHSIQYHHVSPCGLLLDLPHHIRITFSCEALVFRPCRTRVPIVAWQQLPGRYPKCLAPLLESDYWILLATIKHYCWPLLTILVGYVQPFLLAILNQPLL